MLTPWSMVIVSIISAMRLDSLNVFLEDSWWWNLHQLTEFVSDRPQLLDAVVPLRLSQDLHH